jgi:outer membrane protein assembly factor BamB
MRTSLAPVLVLLVGTHAFAENWPGFRGPTGQGISSEKNLPLKWSRSEDGKAENVAWRVPVPGVGHSSPIVWGEKVFLTATSPDGSACRVLCFNRADGKLAWDREVFKQEPKRKEARNTYATPTPVTDGQRVYAFFGSGGAAAVTLDGEVAWTNTDYPFYSRHGFGASPVLYKDMVIMPYDGSTPTFSHIEEERVGWQKPWDKSFILALDAKTGKERWKAGRGMSRIAHVTPKVADVNGKLLLISAAGDVVQAHDPDTGELLWTAPSKGEGVVPSVVVGEGLAFTSSGFEKTTIRAVRLGGGPTGDAARGKIVWEQTRGAPTLPSFVYEGGLLFSVKENGTAVCLDAKDGKVVWQERIPGGTYAASPVWAEGRLYCLSESGETVVINAGREFKVLQQNPLNDPCQASPAVSNGQFFIRSVGHLYCIGQRNKAQ